MFYENVINNDNNDSKKMWNILNDIMGRKSKSTPSFLQSEGHFITKPLNISNHLNHYFNDHYNYELELTVCFSVGQEQRGGEPVAGGPLGGGVPFPHSSFFVAVIFDFFLLQVWCAVSFFFWGGGGGPVPAPLLVCAPC